MGQVTYQPWRAVPLHEAQQRRLRLHWHAGGRDMQRPTLPGRRRQAVVLGHLQHEVPEGRSRGRRLRPPVPAEQAGPEGVQRHSARLCRPHRRRRANAETHARPRGLLQRRVPRAVSHRTREVQRSQCPGHGGARGLLAVCSPEPGGLDVPGHRVGLHGHQHRPAGRGGADRRLVGERRLPGEPTDHGRTVAEPDRARG